MSYLADWITQHKLTSEFTEVWQEAFPGQPLPSGI
jgi:hypothetical protein